EPEQRNVLRAYYGQGSSIDVIAAGRGVHRATAARRVGQAREQLLSDTRRLLIAELKLSRSELESVMRLIQSQLHLTLSRVFAES
ncbi:MAG: transcriptional regulator, partial [Polyangiaceae bacterium]